MIAVMMRLSAHGPHIEAQQDDARGAGLMGKTNGLIAAVAALKDEPRPLTQAIAALTGDVVHPLHRSG